MLKHMKRMRTRKMRKEINENPNMKDKNSEFQRNETADR